MSDLNLWKRLWRAEMIAKARAERNTIARSWESLKDKTTEYARSQKMILDVREQVLALWLQSPVDLSGDAAQPQGAKR